MRQAKPWIYAAVLQALLYPVTSPARADGFEVYATRPGIISVLDSESYEVAQTFFMAQQASGARGPLFIDPSGELGYLAAGYDVAVVDLFSGSVVDAFTTQGLGIVQRIDFMPDGGLALVMTESLLLVFKSETHSLETAVHVDAHGENVTVLVKPDGSEAYVLSGLFDSPRRISVVDLAARRITATIPLAGTTSTTFAMSPDGERLYVPSGKRILAFDTAEKALVGTIATEGSISSIAVSPDGDLAYLSVLSDVDAEPALELLDLENETTLETIPVGTVAREIRVDSGGSRLYLISPPELTGCSISLTIYDLVSRREDSFEVRDHSAITLGKRLTARVTPTPTVTPTPLPTGLPAKSCAYFPQADRLSVFNIEDETVVGSIPASPYFTRFAVSPDGTRLYFTSRINAEATFSLSVVDTLKNEIVQNIPILAGEPQTIALMSEGRSALLPIFAGCADFATADLLTGNVAGSTRPGAQARERESRFRNVVLSPDESTLYASISKTNEVIALDAQPPYATKKRVRFFEYKPMRLEISPDGQTLYAAAPKVRAGYPESATADEPGALLAIDVSTFTSAEPIEVGHLPVDLDVHPDGTLIYVANAESDTVSVIDTLARAVTAEIPLAKTSSVEIDPSGTTALITTAYPHTLSKIDTASGEILSTIPLSDYVPDLAIAAVPGGCVVPPNSPPTPTPTPTQAPVICIGDCDGNGVVRVDEIIRAINIALGSLAVDACPAFESCLAPDCVRIDELVSSVNNALSGCNR